MQKTKEGFSVQKKIVSIVHVFSAQVSHGPARKFTP